MSTVTRARTKGARGAGGGGISLRRSSLDPVVQDLGLLLGLLQPDGEDSEVLDLNEAWFGAPIEQLRQGVANNADKIAALLGKIMGQAGGNALGLPVSDPALLGTWYPVNLPGTTTPTGVYLVSYEAGGDQVLGLGTLYSRTVQLGQDELRGAAAGPSSIVVEVWAMAPIVKVGPGGMGLVLGTAGFPLFLGIAAEAPSGPLVDAGGVSLAGVRATATIDVAANDPVSLALVVLQLQLPGETSPSDRSLADLEALGGDELLSTASALAVGALGSLLGADTRLQYLPPVLGLSSIVPQSDVRLPLLGWVELFAIAVKGGNLATPFVQWFTALVSDAQVLSTWLSSVARLLGVSTPAVGGTGSRNDPWSVCVLDDAKVGSLCLTLASTIDKAGTRQLYPGLGFANPGIVLGTSSVQIQMQADVELAEFDLVTDGTVAYAGPSSLNASAALALVNVKPGQPLFSGAIGPANYTFGSLRAGVQLAGDLRVVPHFQLVGVQTPNGNYDALDLLQPGQVANVAIAELVDAITNQIQSLLGISLDADSALRGSAVSFGALLASVLGLTAPALPDGVTWPSALAPPLSAQQLANTLQDPAGAIGAYYGKVLQATVGGQPAFFWLVQGFATLLQQAGAPVSITGSGTAADPWKAQLSGTGLPPIALAVWSGPVAEAGAQRLSFGLEATPPLVLPSAPPMVLSVVLDAFSLDVQTQGSFSAGNATLLPGMSVSLSLPQGFETPAVLDAAVSIASASLTAGWSRADGWAWSMHAGQPALVVSGTKMPIGQDLDFDDTASLEALVTKQAKTFAPILVGLLGLTVARTGSPVGLAATGLLGLLPNLGPFLPAGLTWPNTMPVLQIDSFDDPLGVLRTQAAGLVASPANAQASVTLMAWALAGGGSVPTLAGSGTYDDPYQVPLGFANGIGLRVWSSSTPPLLGLGIARLGTNVVAGLQVATDIRLDVLEAALGSTAGTDPVPSLAVLATFSRPDGSPLISVPGIVTVQALDLGFRFQFDVHGNFSIAPVFTLHDSQTADGRFLDAMRVEDFRAAAGGDQEWYLTALNFAIQTLVGGFAANPTFQTVYGLLADLGVALARPTDSSPYGIDPNGWQGLLSDPVRYLGDRAALLLAQPAERSALAGIVQDLLGLARLPQVPAALLDVLAAMGYVAPADQGYAPKPDALVDLARDPVGTLVERFEALVGSTVALQALIARLNSYASIPPTFGIFTLAITQGRFIQLGIAQASPFVVADVVEISGALQLDLQNLALDAALRLYVPAIGAAVVPDVHFAVATARRAAQAAPPLTVSIAFGDGTVPAASPITFWPFDAGTFVTHLAASAPVQALSVFVTQVLEDQILAPYALAQVAFTALGLAFQDGQKRWHFKSLVGLFDDPLSWLLSDAVVGSGGQLDLPQIAKVLATVPDAQSQNGITVSHTGDGGLRIGGLPYELQIDLGVDLKKNLATLGWSLAQPVSLGNGASVETLQFGVGLGPDFQPGISGAVSLTDTVGDLPIFASFGYDSAGFSLVVGESGQGKPQLVLLPFTGWKSLVQQAAGIAVQILLQELTPKLLAALSQAGMQDFANRLQEAGSDLDVADLVTALAQASSLDALLAAALSWLQDRVAAANVGKTTQALQALFANLVPGITVQDGLLSYAPGASVPLTVLAGASTIGGKDVVGLWVELDAPSLFLLQIGLDRTGIAIDPQAPSKPLFSFGLHLSVPIAGQTGPELDLVYDGTAQQLTLSFDPQGGGSPLARELYPTFFGTPPGTVAQSIVDQVEAWLLQLVTEVLPRYVSIAVLNTATVSKWLGTPLFGGGPSAGAVLVDTKLLVQADGKWALNSYQALSQLDVESFLGGLLKALLSTQVRVLAIGTDGGIWFEPDPADASAFGVRVMVPDLFIPALRYVTLQIGNSDTAWIGKAGGTATAPGISVYIPVQDAKPSFADVTVNVTNVGLDVTGANQTALVQLSRFQLGGISPRVLLQLDFAGGTPTVTFGGALTMDGIGISLAPAEATGGDNPIAQNLLGASGGSSSSTPGFPRAGEEGQGGSDAEPANPTFSASVAYVNHLWGGLIAADGTVLDRVVFPVQRSFGPLHVDLIGLGWDQQELLLKLLFGGGVELAGLAASVEELTVDIPVTTPTDFSKYALDLQGLAVSYQGGSVTIAGGLLKQEDPLQYTGGAVIKAGTFSVAALGSYALVETDPGRPDSKKVPSLFVFAALDAALGGPPAFFVTGLAGGFSYNRGLVTPEPADVQGYILVQAALDPSKIFGGDTDPAAALAKLSEIVFPEVGQYWVAAGIHFTSFELLDSFALLVVKFGRTFEIDLIGASVISMPPMVPAADALAYVEMGLVVAFKPAEGVLSVFAQLTPNSFVLSHSAHLTGGFAFFLWFDGQHSGDFVVTLGGYHPAFDKPKWYPDVPRLGLDWPISDSPKIGINGGAYFALTPSAVMAGGHLSLQFQDGPLRAWLDAGADFLITWAPFYFRVGIYVDVGVAFKTELFGVSVTLSASLGCKLNLAGPPVGGDVEIDWYVISFTIPIGDAGQSPSPFGKWDDFAAAMLPKPSDSPSGDAFRGREAADDAPQQVLKLRAAEGLLQDGAAGWTIRASYFTLRADTAIPATTLTVNSGTPFTGPAIGVRPMDATSATTPCTVTVRGSDGKPADLSRLTVAQVSNGAPEALWDVKPFDPDGAPSSATIPGAIFGVTLTGSGPQTTDPIGPIAIADAFDFEPAPKVLPLPFAASPFPPTPVYPPDPHPFQTLETTLADPGVAGKRDAVYQALQDRDVAAPLDPSLAILATYAEDVLLAAPTLQPLGFDIAAGASHGRVVTLEAPAPTRTEPPTPAARGPRLAGAMRRYRHSRGRASADGLLRAWSRTGSGQWIDRRDGAAAGRALDDLLAVSAGDAATCAVVPGSIALWELGRGAGVTARLSDGDQPARVLAFSDAHDPVAARVLEPGSEWTLPAEADHALVLGWQDDLQVVGWQADSLLVRIDERWFVGDGCLVRPQARLRWWRGQGWFRRGALGAGELVPRNRVRRDRDDGTPGWIRTVMPEDVRMAVVLAGTEEGVSVLAARGDLGGYGPEPSALRPADVERTAAGVLLRYAVPPGSGSVSLIVQPRTAEQLRGVLGLRGASAVPSPAGAGVTLTATGVDVRQGASPAANVTFTRHARADREVA